MQVASSKHWLLVPARLDGRPSLGNIKVKQTGGARCSAHARGFSGQTLLSGQTSKRRAPEPCKASGAQSSAPLQEGQSAPDNFSSGGPLQPPMLAAILAAGSVAVISLLATRKGSKEGTPPSTAQSHSGSRHQYESLPMDIGKVKQAAPAALQTMRRYFPEAIEQHTFVQAIAKTVSHFGFTNENCIALVNTCRDEVCRPIYSDIEQQFGLGFDIAGLGGLVNCGKTGFKAAMSHSPEVVSGNEKRERYLFFAFPHISVGETGEVGSLLRRGRGKPSGACGALQAITKSLNVPAEDDQDDAELVLLKRKVLQELSHEQGFENSNLVDVTKAALRAATKDVEDLVDKTVDPLQADYAVVTGIQIHSGNQIPGEPFRMDRTVDYIAPYKMYAVVRGKRQEMQLDAQMAPSVLAMR